MLIPLVATSHGRLITTRHCDLISIIFISHNISDGWASAEETEWQRSCVSCWHHTADLFQSLYFFHYVNTVMIGNEL